jgi:hypothetical protein
MISDKDIVDIVFENIKNKAGTQAEGTRMPYKSGFFADGKYINSYSSLKNNRKLVTEYELRQALKDGSGAIEVPEDAIIGPVALEMIQEKGIKVIRK